MFSLAYKNIKASVNNFFMMVFMIAVPLMQIGLIKKVMDNTAAAQAPAGNRLVEVVTLTASGGSSAIQNFAATILVQFTLMASMFAGAMLVSERENNTLVRLFSAPITKIRLLMGILIGHFITVMLIAAAIIISSAVIFKVEWGSVPLVALISMFAVFVGTSMAFVISGAFKTAKLAGVASSLAIILMTFMSGGYSTNSEPGRLSYFTINRWICDAYVKVMGGQKIDNIIIDLIAMAVIGIIFMISAAVIYRKENIYE